MRPRRRGRLGRGGRCRGGRHAGGRRVGADHAGGGRGQAGIRYVIAVADGDMGAEAVFQTGGGQQVHDLFAGVAAVDEMSCAAAQQQIQGPPGFRQMIVGIG